MFGLSLQAGQFVDSEAHKVAILRFCHYCFISFSIRLACLILGFQLFYSGICLMDRELPPLPIEHVEAHTTPPTRTASSSVVVEGDVLQPQDSGKGAYVFLIGACIIEGMSWGQHSPIILVGPR